MKRNSLFKAKVALAALQSGGDIARTADRFGVALIEVEVWVAQFRLWASRWARRAWR